MKRSLSLTCLTVAVLVCALSGCSKRVLVPEKTILAAYVDFEKAHKYGLSFTEAMISALPDELRLKTKAEYEEMHREINDIMAALNPKWIVVAYGGTLKELKEFSASPGQGISFAVKIHASEDDASESLRKLVPRNMKSTQTDDGEVYEGDSECYGRIGGEYLIFGASPSAFKSMYELYRENGDEGRRKGNPSAEFDDLAHLSGNTIARISTAPISSLIKRFEMTKTVEDLGARCKDQKLVDLLLGMGAATLDIKADKDALVASLRIACESTKDAKTVSALFHALAFTSRAGCVIGTYLAKEPKLLGKIAAETHLSESSLNSIIQQIDVLRDGTQSTDVNQNGKTAEISMSLTSDSPVISRCAVPFFINYRNGSRAAACFANMRQLKAAAEAHLKKHPGDAAPSLDAICGPEDTKILKTEPRCPLGGHYTITLKEGSVDVVCPHAAKGHALVETASAEPGEPHHL